MNDDLRVRLSATIPEWCSLLKYAIVRLYFADRSRKFKYSQLCGAICLILDRKQCSTKHLKLYDLTNFSVTFEMELYLGFPASYKKLSDTFSYFPLSNGWGGLLFQNEDDERSFRDKVEQYGDNVSPEEFKRQVARELTAGTGESVTSLKYEPGLVFLNRAYMKKSKINEAIFDQLSNAHISKPTTIERTSNAGWDPINQNFKLDELPKELKQLLRRAGITKKDLKEKAIALMVYEILINPTQLDSILVKMKGPAHSPAKKEAPKGSKASDSRNFSFAPGTAAPAPSDDLAKHPLAALPPTTLEEFKVGEDPASSVVVPLPPSLANKKSFGIPSPPLPGAPVPPGSSSVVMSSNPAPIQGNYLDQIKAGRFNLKKPDPSKNNMFKGVIGNQQAMMKAASTLHAAIVERRGQLMKNQVKDSDDEDWSDSES